MAKNRKVQLVIVGPHAGKTMAIQLCGDVGVQFQGGKAEIVENDDMLKVLREFHNVHVAGTEEHEKAEEDYQEAKLLAAKERKARKEAVAAELAALHADEDGDEEPEPKKPAAPPANPPKK